MSTFVKSLSRPFCVLLLASASWGLRAECVGQAPAHAAFCAPHSEQVCRVHSAVCLWKEAAVKIEVVVKSDKDKSCVARAGKSAHGSFCKALDQAACDVHASLCAWE